MRVVLACSAQLLLFAALWMCAIETSTYQGVATITLWMFGVAGVVVTLQSNKRTDTIRRLCDAWLATATCTISWGLVTEFAPSIVTNTGPVLTASVTGCVGVMFGRILLDSTFGKTALMWLRPLHPKMNNADIAQRIACELYAKGLSAPYAVGLMANNSTGSVSLPYNTSGTNHAHQQVFNAIKKDIQKIARTHSFPDHWQNGSEIQQHVLTSHEKMKIQFTNTT